MPDPDPPAMKTNAMKAVAAMKAMKAMKATKRKAMRQLQGKSALL